MFDANLTFFKMKKKSAFSDKIKNKMTNSV